MKKVSQRFRIGEHRFDALSISFFTKLITSRIQHGAVASALRVHEYISTAECSVRFELSAGGLVARLRFEGDRWMIELVARFSGVHVRVKLMEYQTVKCQGKD